MTLPDECPVEDEEKYVCDFDSNEAYPADDPVVDCIPPHDLRLDRLAGEQTPDPYTYPVSRLEPIEVVVVERTAQATITPPVVVEGLGECGNCGTAITEEADRYIEDDGGAYCDISCYNEALTS